MSVLKQKRLNPFAFLIIIFVINSILISSVNADYNVKTGDAYRFEIRTLRNPWGFVYRLHDPSSDLVFEEGKKLVVKFTDVHPLDIDFTFTIDGITADGNPFFENILVQNRNWDELTEKFENQGYNITETSDLWMLSQNNSTVIEAEYSKKNGVVKRFYAFNESQLVSILNAGEIEIVRLTEDSISHNWAYSFLAVLPITVLVVFLIKTNRFPKIKSTKKTAYKGSQPQQPIPFDELSEGHTITTTTIINGKMVEIRKVFVKTPDGMKWEVTNLETKETWFVDK